MSDCDDLLFVSHLPEDGGLGLDFSDDSENNPVRISASGGWIAFGDGTGWTLIPKRKIELIKIHDGFVRLIIESIGLREFRLSSIDHLLNLL